MEDFDMVQRTLSPNCFCGPTYFQDILRTKKNHLTYRDNKLDKHVRIRKENWEGENRPWHRNNKVYLEKYNLLEKGDIWKLQKLPYLSVRGENQFQRELTAANSVGVEHVNTKLIRQFSSRQKRRILKENSKGVSLKRLRDDYMSKFLKKYPCLEEVYVENFDFDAL